jgi:hypothetical protein
VSGQSSDAPTPWNVSPDKKAGDFEKKLSGALAMGARLLTIKPFMPRHFNADQQCDYLTGYRLKCLDLALAKFLQIRQSLTENEEALLLYERMTTKVLSTAGVKRKPDEVLQNDQNKRVDVNGTAAGGPTAGAPLFALPSSGTQTKAGGPAGMETSRQGTEKLPASHTSPLFQPTSKQSETSRLFANIAGSDGGPSDAPKPPSRPSLGISDEDSTTKGAQSSTASMPPFGVGQANAPAGNLANSGPPKSLSSGDGDAAPKAASPSGAIAPPGASGNASTANATPAASEPPRFNIPSGVDFMAQFGQAAQKTAAKEKAKRKAEEFDSDEETEEAWEKRYDEEQRAKRLRIEQAAKGEGFRPSPSLSAASGESIFSFKPSGSGTSTPNMFGTLSNGASDNEGSKAGDADSEGGDASEGSDADDEKEDVPPAKPAGRSIFDRLEYDEDGTPRREIPPSMQSDKDHSEAASSDAQKTASPFSIFSSGTSTPTATVNPFAKSASATATNTSKSLFGPTSAGAPTGSPLFGTSNTNAIAGSSPLGAASKQTSTAELGDHTWKPTTPIKFGGTSSAPTLNVTSPSPTRPVDEPKTNAFTGLFGSGSSTPVSNPFAHLNTPASSGVGFNFGSPAKPASSLSAPSIFSSLNSSRDTSPGATTGDESTGEGADEQAVPDEQLDLASSRAGEEKEDVLFEVKARARELAKKKDGDEKEWILRGVGDFRVLKRRDSKKTRVLMRAGPSGKIVLNSGLMANMTYRLASEKVIAMGVATNEGNINSWSISVGKKEDAAKLVEVLESNKTS